MSSLDEILPKAPKTPKPVDHATSTHGKRDPFSGGMIYKTGGGMIRASRLLSFRIKKNPPPQDGEENAAEVQE